MPVLDSNNLREAVLRVAAEYAEGQTPEPASPASAVDQQGAQPQPPDPKIKEHRNQYETRRGDLIRYGGISLEKILTQKEYAHIRQDFGIDESVDYKKEIAALDHASRRELKHKTLRDIVSSNNDDKYGREFILQDKALSHLLTPAGNIDRQIQDSAGSTARKYDAAIMDKDERELNRAYREQLAAHDVANGPELYIRYDPVTAENNDHPVTQTVLKDGTRVMVVSLDAWKKDSAGVKSRIDSEIVQGHHAEREQIEGYLAHFKDTPLRDILTKPEFAKLRDDLSIPDFSGADDKAGKPADLDALDLRSRRLLDKQTFKDIFETTFSSTIKGSPTYNYPAAQDLYQIELVPPSDHKEQLSLILGIGDFAKGSNTDENGKEKTLTLVDPSKLDGKEKEFYDHYADMAKKMGLDKPPELYYLSYDTGSEGMAVLLKDGTRAVMLDKSIAELPPEQRILTIGHEDGHLNALMKEKIRNLYDIIDYVSKPFNSKTSVRNELNADRTGAGPLGVCDAQASEKDLERGFSVNDPKKFASMVDSHLEALAMGNLTHPLPDDRMNAMRNYHPEGCVPYYPTPAPAKAPDSPKR